MEARNYITQKVEIVVGLWHLIDEVSLLLAGSLADLIFLYVNRVGQQQIST